MLLAIYAHDKYLNVCVPINGTKHTLKEVKFVKLSSTPPCIWRFCTKCKYYWMPAVYAKCIFCLRKNVCFVWWKLHSIWVNSSRVTCMMKWIFCQKLVSFIPGPFSVNVRLPLTNHIRHFCYTRQTTGITPLKSCVLWCWLVHPPVKVYICWC